MKKLIYTLVFCSLAFVAEAKKRQTETWVGFSHTMYAPFKPSVSGLPPVRMGLPSFSYASSVEQRFSLHHKLTFSLQYALAYFNLNMNQLQETLAKNAHVKEVSAGVGMNAIYQFRKEACVITGFTLNKPVYSCFRGDVKSEVPGQTTTLTQQRFDIRDIRSWNPSFHIGFEKQFSLFNRNLRYSLQYQIGFIPGRELPYGAGQLQRGYMQGITLGLKYKL
jgi:hypothetical protein